MDYLNLSSNFLDIAKIATLSDNDIKYLATMCIKRVDLSRNFIAKIPYTISDLRLADCVEYLSFGDNVFQQNNILPLFGMFSYSNITYFDLSQDAFPVPEHNSKMSLGSTYFSNLFNAFYENVLTFFDNTFEITITLSESLRVLNASGISPMTETPERNNLLLKFVGRGLEVLDLSFNSCFLSKTISFYIFHTSEKSELDKMAMC